MSESKWRARTKRDLMIEVWESLDCESVGATELKAIEQAVRERFGDGAVESHASVARLLADEGAELRHPEVLELYVLQRSSDPYREMLGGVLTVSDFEQAADSIRRLEELRHTFASKGDKTGLRRVREVAINGKRQVRRLAADKSLDSRERARNAEIEEWFSVWLKQPEIFETWLELRMRTKEFQSFFGVR